MKTNLEHRLELGERRRIAFWSPRLGLALAALSVAVVSCSTPVKDTGPVRTFQQEGGDAGFGGEVVINAVTTNATIVALEPAQRTIVLRYPDGRIAPYKAGPEVVNFDLLKVGDEVKTTVADQMGVAVAKAGTPLSAQQNISVAKGPKGTAGGSLVDIEHLTGKVVQIDAWQHLLTLQLNNGQTRTLKVLDMINLTDFQPGDEVTVNLTEARTFVVEKP